MTNDQLIKFPASGYHSFDADLCLQWLLQWLWCKVQSLESLKEPEMVPEMCQNTAEMLQIVRKKVLLQRTLWASLSSIWCQGNSLWADVCTQMAISEYVSRLSGRHSRRCSLVESLVEPSSSRRSSKDGSQHQEHGHSVRRWRCRRDHANQGLAPWQTWQTTWGLVTPLLAEFYSPTLASWYT